MIVINDVVELALTQSGKPYVFGAEAAATDPDPEALDCSELIEWVCARLAVRPRFPDGSWYQYQHCLKHRTTLAVADALRTRGALLFAFQGDPLGSKRPRRAHVAMSLGDGKTIEARSQRHGVGTFAAARMSWSHAGLIPGVRY